MNATCSKKAGKNKGLELQADDIMGRMRDIVVDHDLRLKDQQVVNQLTHLDINLIINNIKFLLNR